MYYTVGMLKRLNGGASEEQWRNIDSKQSGGYLYYTVDGRFRDIAANEGGLTLQERMQDCERVQLTTLYHKKNIYILLSLCSVFALEMK